MMGIAALVAASILQASDVAAPANAAVVVGANTSTVHVMINKIDNGARAWFFPSGLGTQATIPPGHYNLTVLCIIVPTHPLQWTMAEATIAVEAGHVYGIVGTISGRKCNITMSMRS
jgi:hypothetical protein